jgi:hypothetical protein
MSTQPEILVWNGGGGGGMGGGIPRLCHRYVHTVQYVGHRGVSSGVSIFVLLHRKSVNRKLRMSCRFFF